MLLHDNDNPSPEPQPRGRQTFTCLELLDPQHQLPLTSNSSSDSSFPALECAFPPWRNNERQRRATAAALPKQPAAFVTLVLKPPTIASSPSPYTYPHLASPNAARRHRYELLTYNTSACRPAARSGRYRYARWRRLDKRPVTANSCCSSHPRASQFHHRC